MTVTTDTGRTEWLAWRQEGIGASDVAAILGLSPWASPWSVWADKCGLLPPEPDNEAMAAGRWLEAAIGPWFTHETGLHVAGEQTWCTHGEYAHHRCTVDGFVFDLDKPHVWETDDPRIALNARTARDYTFSQALGDFEVKVTGPGRRWDEVPPPHYQSQGQWQMHVTGLPRVWFAVLMGRRLDIHELARDQDDIDYMVERVDAFWADHVLTGTPPATDGHDATLRALAAVHPDHTPGLSVEADDALRTEITLWRQAKANKRTAEKLEKQAAAAMQAALGEAEELTIDGQRVASWRTQSARRLDGKALAAARPEIAAEFTRESTYRVLRDHAPKETS
jgi:putative phage-type endonuclease